VPKLEFVLVRSEILKPTSIKMATFWDVATCSLVGIGRVSEEITASIIMIRRTSTPANSQLQNTSSWRAGKKFFWRSYSFKCRETA
jgi:hypothetical protein